MSDTIKGLTVKIGADNSDFLKELKKVDREINTTSKTAKELEKGLKFDYNDKKFLQAQKQMQNALDLTRDKAAAIREQLAKMEAAGNVNTSGYEKLQLELAKAENNAAKLENEIKQLDKIKLENLTKEINKVGDGFIKAGQATKGISAMAAAGIAGMTALAKSSVKTADEISTLATNYGLTTEAIQRWSYVAAQSDVESNVLYKSLQKLNVAMGDQLTTSTSTAAKALSQLGLNAADFQNADEMFTAVISKISEFGSVAEQTAIASDIFGEKYASSMVSLFNRGQDAINGYVEEFKAIGFVSDDVIRKGAEFDNQFRQVTQSLENAKLELGIALIPILESLADILTNKVIPLIQRLTDWFNNLGKTGQNTVFVILGIAAALSPVLTLVGKLINFVPKLITWVKSLNSETLKATMGFSALAGAMALSINLIADWKKMSTIEKILKTLSVAALVAAAAVTVFHASWSMGIAVGVISAAVVAGVAAIKAAGDSIGVDTKSGAMSEIDSYAASTNSKVPSVNQNANSYGSYTEDNSEYNITINFTPSGSLSYDSKELAQEIIKEIITMKQARG